MFRGKKQRCKRREMHSSWPLMDGRWRSKSYGNESFWARIMTLNSLILQKVKEAAKWSFAQNGTALGTWLSGTVPQLTEQLLAATLLLAHSCPLGCLAPVSHIKTQKGFRDKVLFPWQIIHSVKSFLILRHYLGMEFEAMIWSVLDVLRRICPF